MSCSDASGTAAPARARYSQPGFPVYTQLLGQPSSLPWTGSPWPLSAQAGRELLIRATGQLSSWALPPRLGWASGRAGSGGQEQVLA